MVVLYHTGQLLFPHPDCNVFVPSALIKSSHEITLLPELNDVSYNPLTCTRQKIFPDKIRPNPIFPCKQAIIVSQKTHPFLNKSQYMIIFVSVFLFLLFFSFYFHLFFFTMDRREDAGRQNRVVPCHNKSCFIRYEKETRTSSVKAITD